MLKYFKVAQEIVHLVRLANRISDERPGNTPKFGFLFTNRSFLVPAFGLILSTLIALDMPLTAELVVYLQTITPEIMAGHVITMITSVTAIWAVFERMRTPARVVVTRKQAEKAVMEVVGNDELSNAIRSAINSK